MSWVTVAICFLVILVVFVIITIHLTLKRSSDSVLASKHILNKFEPNDTAPKLTEMIEFHKNNRHMRNINTANYKKGW